MQFKRLAQALLREGIEITQDGPVYQIRRASYEGPAAEILLPEGFPLETKAVKQLAAFASASHPNGGHVCGACATPDFHPGDVVPVGCVVSSSDMVIPQAIGTDINCGMRLDLIDVTLDQFMARKKELVELLRGDLLLGTRDLPLTPQTLHAIYQYGAYGWEEELYKKPMGLFARTKDHFALDAKASTWHQGSFDADTKWVKDRIDYSRDVIRDADLGTVGGGNHFVEIQMVEEILDYEALVAGGYPNLRPGQLCFMIHTGSRSVGKGIGTRWNHIAKERWPKGHKWPEVFPLCGDDAHEYMQAMGCAANFAAVNRVVLSAMVRDRFRQVFGPVGSSCFYDVSHNIVTYEGEGFLHHRKGATPAHEGQWVLIPGSMGHSSFIGRGLGSERFLHSCSHGAGRVHTRFEMGRKGRPDFDLGLEGVECITLREERLLEEAPAAYKDIDPVMRIQHQQGLAAPVARLRPLLTFKS